MIIQTLIGSVDAGGLPDPGGMKFDPTYIYQTMQGPALLLYNFNKSVVDSVPGVYSILTTQNLAGGGKYMWSFTMSDYTDPLSLVGVGNTDIVLDNYLGSDTNSFGIDNQGTAYYNGSTVTTGLPTFQTPFDIIDVAFDYAGMLFWYRVNNGTWNGSGTADPATGAEGISVGPISGTIRPAVAVGGINYITSFTINLTSPYSVPSGFTFYG